MKKRMIALLAVLTVIAGVLGTTAAAREDTSLRVGYAGIDINPYVYHYVDENREGEVPVETYLDAQGRAYYTNWNRDPQGNTECELMPLPLRGFREPMERLSLTYKMDDNGDGIVNNEDGLHGTCIAMTDTDGNTLITISLDIIGVDEGYLLDEIRRSISEATGTQRDHIMVAGTHTHFAPDFSNISNSVKNSTETYIRYCDGKYFTGEEIYNYLSTYRADLIRVLTDAAVRAMADRETAIMSKGSLDTSEAENCPAGNRMNVVRHYAMTRQKILTSSGSYVTDSDGNYVVNPNGAVVNYVAGDNFNGGGDPPGTRYGSYLVTKAQSVAESDDMLHALKFTFPGTEKEPVVLLNWRAHPCFNRNVSQDADTNGWPYATSYYQVSGDYVNALRKELAGSGIRVSFHQGASGNINGTDPTMHNWLKDEPSQRGNIYGHTLGKIALELVGENGKGLQTVEGGEIRVAHAIYQNSGNTNSPAILAAARLYSEFYEGPIPLEGEGYRVVDSNGSGYGETGERVIDTNTGAYVTIASRYHANAVLSRAKVLGKKAYGQVEVGAVTIGNSVAFVAAPGELYDRYDDEGTVQDSATSGWKSLVRDTYGTPFVLGYCNGTRGYFPNRAAYSYNYGLRDSKGNLSNDAVGSYEAQTTRLAPGGGENMIRAMGHLLDLLQSEQEDLPEMCQHCGKEVAWSPLSQAHTADLTALDSGHYYLTEDITGTVKLIEEGKKVCLYLNGHTYTGATRAFTVEPRGEFSIQGEGVVQGKDSVQGCAVCVHGNGRADLYGGTLTMAPDYAQTPKTGGTVYIVQSGVFNQHGGTVTGGRAYYRGGNVYVLGEYNLYGGSITNGVAEGVSNGGNVFVSSDGRFHMYGGTISGGQGIRVNTSDKPNGGNVYVDGRMVMTGGRIENGYAYWAGGDVYVAGTLELSGGTVTGGKTDTVSRCVHFGNSGKLRLSGDPTVDQLRSGNAKFLTVAGEFTGSAIVEFATVPAVGAVVGTSENAVFMPDRLIFRSASYKNTIVPSGSDLVIAAKGTAKLSDSAAVYDTVAQAVAAAKGTDAYVILQTNVVETLATDGTVCVDLNGYTASGGAVARGDGQLLLRDSMTDDFSVADGVYGKVTGTVSGNVKPQEGYLLLAEAEGTSVHRTEMALTHMNLRPNACGVYFTASFKGNAQFFGSVQGYGIALNALEIPTEENMQTTTLYTDLSASDRTGEATQSVLLENIMDFRNTTDTNWKNAATRIYARTYIQTADGYLFGDVVCTTLQEMTEYASDNWDSLTEFQQISLLDMYSMYWDVMDYWLIPKLQAAWE